MLSANQRIPKHTSAAAMPMAIAQKNSATVILLIGATSGIASENVPRPVSESSPMKIR